jgi:hypothetical protein
LIGAWPKFALFSIANRQSQLKTGRVLPKPQFRSKAWLIESLRLVPG